MKKLLAILLLFSAPAYAGSISGVPITSQQTSVAASSLVAKATTGFLTGFSVTSGATAGYVLIIDAATAPSNGTVTPRFCYALPASSTVGASWIQSPVPFTTGIVIEFSSTGCFAATSSATAFISTQIQ